MIIFLKQYEISSIPAPDRIVNKLLSLASKNLGTIAMVMQFACLLLGNPSQIMQIIEQQSSVQISIPYLSLIMGSSLAWLMYGIKIKDKPMMYSTSIGSTMTFILLIVTLIYR